MARFYCTRAKCCCQFALILVITRIDSGAVDGLQKKVTGHGDILPCHLFGAHGPMGLQTSNLFTRDVKVRPLKSIQYNN